MSNGKCHLQADELTAHSEKRMKELEKEIQDCERAMVSYVNDQQDFTTFVVC